MTTRKKKSRTLMMIRIAHQQTANKEGKVASEQIVPSGKLYVQSDRPNLPLSWLRYEMRLNIRTDKCCLSNSPDGFVRCL